VNARVETMRDEVDLTIVNRHVERHVWIFSSEGFELGPQNQRRGGLGHQEAHGSRGSRAEFPELTHRGSDFEKRGAQVLEEAFPRVRRRNASRRPGEQPYADALFELADGPT
jgi:hypothetical protein